MKDWHIRKLFTFIISLLLVCVVCAAAFAEGATAPAETLASGVDLEEDIPHILWGFFRGWAEGDINRMQATCADEWKAAAENPVSVLQGIQASGKPRGYQISSISGKGGDPTCPVSVTVQQEADNGEYTYTAYEIQFRLDQDGYYGIDPTGFSSGIPAAPVAEEDMTLMTPDEIIRSNMGFHDDDGVYDRLIPIHLSAEKQGIRMEVVSGYVQENEAKFMIALQDTEGKYGGYILDPSFLNNIDGSFAKSWMNLYHDGQETKDTYLVTQELESPVEPEDREVPVGVEDVWIKEEEIIDLVPLLKQYGKTEQGIAPPELEERRHSSEETPVPKDVKILDYHQPLDIPLFKDVCLTGIGWIDGQLHVQFHNKGREYIDMRNGRGSAASVWVSESVYGKTYAETDVDYSPLRWDLNDDGWTEWYEYIINCRPEEAEKLELSAEISVCSRILEDDWSVRIPLKQICTGENAGGDEAKTESSTAAAETGIAIDETHFPDAAFRDFVKQYDYDRDGSLSGTEADSVTQMNIAEKNVKSLKGIEFFSRLNSLECGRNQLTELDVSRNTELTWLWCEENQLTALDVSHNLKLTNLYCGDNRLTELDVSKNTELLDLTCIFNRIRELDISNNTKLTDLGVSGNCLTELDISHNPELKWVCCPWNELTELDVSHNPGLVNLSCAGNKLTKLDLSNNADLDMLYCMDNRITSLDLSNCPKLAGLVKRISPREKDGEWGWQAEDETHSNYVIVDRTVEVYTEAELSVKGEAAAPAVNEATAGFVRAYPGIKDDYDQYSLWEFFCRWAEKDEDNLPFSLTMEERNAAPETQARIRDLLAQGTPLAYQVNNVILEEGERIRKYDCTVLMDPENGNEPQYRHYVISTKQSEWSYEIDLEHLDCLGPADRNPAVETISLSAETIMNDMLDYFFEGAGDQLQPIGVSSEKNGIRMEIISGAVKGKEAWILYSLQDLEGKYEDCSFDIFDIENNIGELESFSPMELYRDRKEHKSYQMYNKHLAEEINADNRDVFLRLPHLVFTRTTWADLIPLLKQFGTVTEGTAVPENTWDTDGNVRTDLKVLDYTRPLDVSLSDKVSLTGIGWIDNQLHIQLCLDNPMSWSVNPVDSLAGQRSFYDDRRISYSPLEWFAGDNRVYMEYVFDYKPEDLEYLNLNLWATVGVKEAEGDWRVEFPLNLICPDAKEAAPEGTPGTDPAEGKFVFDPDAERYVYRLNGIDYLLNTDGTAIIADASGYISDTDSVTIPETIEIRYTVNAVVEEGFRKSQGAGEIVLPSTVTSFGRNAFSGSNMKAFTIPEGTEAIANNMFSGCENLADIRIPESVTSLGKGAFSHCTALTTVLLPDNIEVVEAEAFDSCTALSAIVLPKHAEAIGDRAFMDCENLVTVTLPENLTSIGRAAFLNCGNLAAVEIPESVTSIGKDAFMGCGRLVCIVAEDSYAMQYCRDNGIPCIAR